MTAPSYSPPLEAITTALLVLFRADAPKKGARWVYDAAYDGDPTTPAYPYHLLYAVPGGSSDPFPSLDGEYREAALPFQLTTVSNYRNQCQNAAQAAHARYLARGPDGAWLHPLVLPAGWREIGRAPDPALPGVDRAGDPPRAVYSSPNRFTLTIAHS